MVRVIEPWRGIHIVGVGGSATSGLARLLRARGVRVSGSDGGNPRLIDILRGEGFEVTAGHDATNLGRNVDVVVHSAAVPDENPEIREAHRRGIPVRKFAEFLGEWVRSQRTIAVSGTHGKTSTAGMLASILTEAGRDPSFLIGGEHLGFNGNWRAGGGADFIVEACEFDRSFHSYRPEAGIITSLELDHPDIYPDEEVLAGAFQAFVGGFNEGGLLLLNGDSPALREVATPPGVTRRTFGRCAECDWQVTHIWGGETPRFGVSREGVPLGEIHLRVPGRHNVANALAALALSLEDGIPFDVARRGLARFEGMERRFQRRAEVEEVALIDDYAHHPTEVRCALEAAREAYPGRRIWAVFQPHQFGRLRSFGPAFGEALGLADRIALLPVYSVREDPAEDGRELFDLLLETLRARAGRRVVRFSCFDEACLALASELRPGDVCLFLGAGDIVRLTDGVESCLTKRRALARS